jgi:hypothetical protein
MNGLLLLAVASYVCVGFGSGLLVGAFGGVVAGVGAGLAVVGALLFLDLERT